MRERTIKAQTRACGTCRTSPPLLPRSKYLLCSSPCTASVALSTACNCPSCSVLFSIMIRKLTVIGLALSAFATAAPTSAPHVVHEERDVVSDDRWMRLGRVPSHARFPVRVGLTQSNLDDAHEHLIDVSSPASPNYAKHCTCTKYGYVHA